MSHCVLRENTLPLHSSYFYLPEVSGEGHRVSGIQSFCFSGLLLILQRQCEILKWGHCLNFATPSNDQRAGTRLSLRPEAMIFYFFVAETLTILDRGQHSVGECQKETLCDCFSNGKPIARSWNNTKSQLGIGWEWGWEWIKGGKIILNKKSCIDLSVWYRMPHDADQLAWWPC